MRRQLYFVGSMVSKFSTVLAYLAGASAIAMMVSICYEVIARWLFNAPTIWSFEISGYLLVLITFFAASEGLKKGSHVNVDLIVTHLPNRLRFFIHLIFTSLIAFYAFVLVWQSGELALRSYHLNEHSNTLLGVPMVIPELFVPIGCFILGLQAIIIFSSDIKLLLDKGNPKSRHEEK